VSAGARSRCTARFIHSRVTFPLATPAMHAYYYSRDTSDVDIKISFF
jgi:hypothetical protein